MIRPRLLALIVPLLLAACDRPNDPIEPVAGDGTAATSTATPVPDPNAPVTDPAVAPAPAGTTLPTAPTPAGTMPTDPVSPAPPTDAMATATAIVTLKPTAGHNASGVLELEARGGAVTIRGRLMGLAPDTEHGFHVHETGDCSAPDASSAGGHFNPGSDPHGRAGSAAHHAGDLPSLRSDATGAAEVSVTSNRLEIGSGGPRDVLGRAMIVHRNPDDFTTQPDGAAGPRITCGVIVRR